MTLLQDREREFTLRKIWNDEAKEVWVRNFPAKRRAKITKEHGDYRLLSIPNKPLFRQFRYQEQNWGNNILFIPESE